MILHLASDENFIDHAIKIFEKVNPDQNIFLIPGTENKLKYLKTRSNKIIVTPINSKLFIEIKENITNYKGIIIHNLHEDYKKKFLSTINSRIYIHWMSWGTDLYSIPQLSSRLILPITRKKILASKAPFVLLKLEQIIQNNCSYLWDLYSITKGNKINYKKTLKLLESINSYTTVIPEERIYVNKYLHLNDVPFIPFKYVTTESDIKGEQNQFCTGDDYLIGNSSIITNNHLDAFNILKKTYNFNRRVYVPLSYGDTEYALKIIEEGRKIFGSNFIELTEFMSLQQFNNVLSNCGNVIMNHCRQQALGTILISLWKGARVFLNPKNPLKQFFNSNGFITFSLNDLKIENELPSYKFLAETNRRCIQKIYDHEVVLEEASYLINHIYKSHKLDENSTHK